jgi:hypothetical protein
MYVLTSVHVKLHPDIRCSKVVAELDVMLLTDKYTLLHVYRNGYSLLVNVFLDVIDDKELIFVDRCFPSACFTEQSLVSLICAHR